MNIRTVILSSITFSLLFITVTHHQTIFLHNVWDLYPLSLGLNLAHHGWSTLTVFIPVYNCGWYVIYIKDHVGSTSGHIITDPCKVPLQKPCKIEKISLNSEGMLLFSLIWGFFYVVFSMDPLTQNPSTHLIPLEPVKC